MCELFFEFPIIVTKAKLTYKNSKNISLFKEKILSIPSIRFVKNIKKTDIDIFINIKDDFVKIKSRWFIDCWSGSLSIRDAYIFFNALAYKLFYQQNLITIHATSILTPSDTVILIIGDFAAGKSTLAHFCNDNNYRICSSDQTVVTIKNKQLYFVSGSILDKFNNVKNILNYKTCNLPYKKVSKVIILSGMCDNGKLSVNRISDLKIISKRLSTHLFWPFYSFVSLNQDFNFIRMLPRDASLYNKFFKNIRMIFILRGSKKNIFEWIRKC